jgi:hypothetical protein
MFIPDPNYFPSRISDPNFFYPGSVSKNASILTQKRGFQALGNMIRDVHPCSGSLDPDPDFLVIPDPGSRGQKCTGSRIRNTKEVCLLVTSYSYVIYCKIVLF